MKCSRYIVDKISNPDMYEGEVDGIILGGNRNNSYAWCMEERNGYLYIGTINNIVGTLSNIINMQEEAKEIFEDLFEGIIPKDNEENRLPQIIKVNPYTSETKVVYMPEENTDNSYRMVVKFEEKLFFGSVGKTNSRIILIDENDRASIVFDEGGQSSFRAGTVHNGKLYFAGIDSRIKDNNEYRKFAILEKDSNCDYIWNRVADYKDFIDYALDDGLQGDGSVIWDIISYNNDLYSFISTAKGFVVFKGHKGNSYEQPNEYGWVWTEVVGDNSQYNIGMLDNTNENLGISYAATPYVFKDKMYFGTFDNFFSAITNSFSVLVEGISKREYENTLSKSLLDCYNNIQNPQKLYCMDKYNNIEEVIEVQSLLSNTCNEYIWRFSEYEDKLFFSTFDAGIVYNLLITLIEDYYIEYYGKNILETINNVSDIIEDFENIELINEMSCFRKSIYRLLKNINFINIDKVRECYKDISCLIEELICVKYYYSSEENKEKLNNIKLIKNSIKSLWDELDTNGLVMYISIKDLVDNNEFGFDLYESCDGVNFNVVTLDGFEDKYNYGGRTMISNENGLFIGTANPFYGAQVWRVTSFIY